MSIGVHIDKAAKLGSSNLVKPVTQYTKSGRINIAYQVFGSGPIDLVYIPGWVSNIDWMWACPELVNFLQELGKIARVILFDKRGTGLSDRVVELSTLEERMDDIRAVMDAVDSEKAVLFGHSEGGSVSALFAATYPNRVISLITFGIFAKRRFTPEYPWAPTDEERQIVYDMIGNNWGSGKMNLESLAPSKRNDKVFMDWLANYFRSGASPSAAMVLTKMNTEVDIIDILGSIKVPTLIMQRRNDIDVKIEEGRFIASRIEGARFVEFSGSDHLFWVGNTKEILDEMKAFILNVKPKRNYEERLFTIVSGEFRSPSQIQAYNIEPIKEVVEQYRGKILRSKKNTFVATFEGPSKAVHCSVDLTEFIRYMEAELAIFIHIREIPVEEIHIECSEAEQFVQAMLSVTKAGQIQLTQTVKNLLSGAGFNFSTPKVMINPVTKAPISLVAIIDEEGSEKSLFSDNKNREYPKNDSLLESVLHCIDRYLGEESFGVESLCKEIGLSERQLQRKLKAITNKSPIQLISSVRLYRAKELLLNTGSNITEIAFQTGFSSSSYFSKRFKQEFGYSPTVYVEKFRSQLA